MAYVLIVDEIRDLGTLPGHTWSEAHAINELGAMAGSSATAAGTVRAVMWPSPIVPPGNLGHLGGDWSEAWGINDARQVVGNSREWGSNAPTRGFLWTPSSGIEDLGLLWMTLGNGPVVWFTANDINNNGAIVGDFENVYGRGGYLAAIGASLVPQCPPDRGLLYSSATAINDDGYFTGKVHCIGGPGPAPYVATVSTLTTLAGYSFSTDQGYAINGAGKVAGGFLVIGPGPAGLSHAFRWSQAAGLVDIHPPNDTVYESVARGINTNGLIVGSKYAGLSSKAFVYGQGIQMTTLPDLCTTRTPYSTAFAVNDSGWVVGGSRNCSGDYHATLWKVRVVARGI